MEESQIPKDNEIVNLNIDDLDAEGLEQRLELAAANLDALWDFGDCGTFGSCTTFTDNCGTFGDCGTYGSIK